MKNLERLRLEACYRQTAYRVFLPQQTVDLRVDARAPELDAFLSAQGVCEWCVITACNPGSRRFDNAQNATRMENLATDVTNAGYRFLQALGVGDDGSWPAEPSLFVMGMNTATALSLASRYGQNAVLAGHLGITAQLLWCKKERGRE